MTIEFQPSRLRLLCQGLLGAPLGVGIASLAIYLHLGQWPELMNPGMVGAFIGLVLSTLITPVPGTVKLEDRTLVWRAWFGRTRYVSIDDLDRERSRRRTTIDRILGRYTLHSQRGDKIRINSFALGAAKTAKLFALLGIARDDATGTSHSTELPN